MISLTKSLSLNVICTCNTINSVINENNEDEHKLYTVQDGIDAITILYSKYGYEIAAKIEKMYRCETRNFESLQYQHCGTPGMEAVKGSSAPYYGWGSLKSFLDINSNYKTTGVWSHMENKGLADEGGIKQDTKSPKSFVKMNSVLGAMEFVLFVITKRGGRPGSWYSFDEQYQDKYDLKIKGYILYISNSLHK